VNDSFDTNESIRGELALPAAAADGPGVDRLNGPVAKKGWRSAARNAAIVAVALGVVVAIYAERSTIARAFTISGPSIGLGWLRPAWLRCCRWWP
jgi:hypothetical protein